MFRRQLEEEGTLELKSEDKVEFPGLCWRKKEKLTK